MPGLLLTSHSHHHCPCHHQHRRHHHLHMQFGTLSSASTDSEVHRTMQEQIHQIQQCHWRAGAAKKQHSLISMHQRCAVL
jgi:hypothetical protein